MIFLGLKLQIFLSGKEELAAANGIIIPRSEEHFPRPPTPTPSTGLPQEPAVIAIAAFRDNNP